MTATSRGEIHSAHLFRCDRSLFSVMLTSISGQALPPLNTGLNIRRAGGGAYIEIKVLSSKSGPLARHPWILALEATELIQI